jgi:hypothetical protein
MDAPCTEVPMEKVDSVGGSVEVVDVVEVVVVVVMVEVVTGLVVEDGATTVSSAQPMMPPVMNSPITSVRHIFIGSTLSRRRRFLHSCRREDEECDIIDS